MVSKVLRLSIRYSVSIAYMTDAFSLLTEIREPNLLDSLPSTAMWIFLSVT